MAAFGCVVPVAISREPVMCIALAVRRASRVRALWLCVVICGLAAFLGRGQSAAGEESGSRKLLLAHYMPWYESADIRGRWGRHWTGFESPHDPSRMGADGLPDIWSHFHPLIGPYDSTDPALLECHLAQMKLAGIDGVVVDWYGVADSLDYPAIHAACRALFDATARFGMVFAVCYEDRAIGMLLDRGLLEPKDADERLRADIGWAAENWFGGAHYAKLAGRPLLLNFGPIHFAEPKPWAAAFSGLSQRPSFFALHHLWRKAGADGGFTWIHWEPWKDAADDAVVGSRLAGVLASPADNSAQVIVSAWPGYKDVYKESRPTLAHRGGETLRQSLAAALDSQSRIVQLVTWNDYGEGTMIEPTYEFGHAFLEIVQAAQRKEGEKLVSFTAADLRLPARLYMARKAGMARPEVLEEAAAALRSGDCGKARGLLDTIR